MNKQTIFGIAIGTAIGIAVAAAGGALALREKPPEFAEVLEVTPIKSTVEPDYAQVISVIPRRDPNEPEFADVIRVKALKQPGGSREVCRDHVVTRQRPVEDEHRVAGTATGAVLGGLLGHRVGAGKGKDAATVVGAIAGGYAGNRVQNNMQHKDTYETNEQRCSMVRDEDRVTGYEVTYSFDGHQDVVKMDRKPGKTLTMINGQVAQDQRAASRSKTPAQPTEFDVTYSYQGREDSIVLDHDPGEGRKIPVENGAVDFNARSSGRVLVAREEIRGYDVMYSIPGSAEKSLVRLSHEPRVGSRLPLKDGKIDMAFDPSATKNR